MGAKRPSARDDLLAARRDWKANFRFRQAIRSSRLGGRRPYRPTLSGWRLWIAFAGRKFDLRTRMRFARDMPGKWSLR